MWIEVVDGVWHDDAVVDPDTESAYGGDDKPNEPDELIGLRYSGWALTKCKLLHRSLDPKDQRATPGNQPADVIL